MICREQKQYRIWKVAQLLCGEMRRMNAFRTLGNCVMQFKAAHALPLKRYLSIPEGDPHLIRNNQFTRNNHPCFYTISNILKKWFDRDYWKFFSIGEGQIKMQWNAHVFFWIILQFFEFLCFILRSTKNETTNRLFKNFWELVFFPCNFGKISLDATICFIVQGICTHLQRSQSLF